MTASAATGLWTGKAYAQEPRRGGTFRVGMHDGNTVDTHDPGTYASRQQIYLAHQYRSYLTLIEPDGTLGPDLATSWSANSDASVWTFELNPNASFHSGNNVTSRDVVASLDHHRGDDTTSAAKALLASVTDIQADGDHTVVVTLNSGNALKLSIDRNEIIEKIAFGAASIGNDFHHSPAQPYWPDDVEQRAYDPDQAKALLKKAGMEGLTVSISTADSLFSGAVDTCVLYAAQAKAAGITVNVVREANDGYYNDVWLKKPFCAVSWGARPTPDVMYTLAYKDDAAWNESFWQNERFNELLLQAKGELDDSLHAEMYREMAIIARDDDGTIIPMFNNFVYARRSNVMHGPNLAASWELDGARGPSRWWFTG